jgi:dihydroxyacid dehydratase/phosphogluconate dehydratase
MMMAMLRLNVPSMFVYGGSILPGVFAGKDMCAMCSKRWASMRPGKMSPS